MSKAYNPLDHCVCGKCSACRVPELLCARVRHALRHPQDLIANHCAALLAPGLLPGNDMIACALELARQNLVTDHVLAALVPHIHGLANGHHHESELRAAESALLALIQPEDVAATVAEIRIRDSDNRPVWCVDNAAGTRLYAWMDSKGWEHTTWCQRNDGLLDGVEPVAGRGDLLRGEWPVGLAALISKELARLDTSEPWGEL